MNDQQLELELRTWSQVQAGSMPSAALRERVMAIPSARPGRRLPFPDWRPGSMMAATRLVVAGVIVASLGGLLVGGFPSPGPADTSDLAAVASAESPAADASPTATASPEPSFAPGTELRSDILPGVPLVTRRMRQAGVFEILADTAGWDSGYGPTGVEVGPGDALVVSSYVYGQAKLGQEEPAQLHHPTTPSSLDECRERGPGTDPVGVAAPNRLVAPDGTYWRVGHTSLWRWMGDCWRSVRLPFRTQLEAEYHDTWLRPEIVDGGLVAVGADGTLWAGFHLGAWPNAPSDCDNCIAKPYLARRDGQGWSTFGPRQGVRWLYGVLGGDAVTMAVDRKGRLWIAGHTTPAMGPGIKTDGCGGVLSFDGRRWQQYLTERCINSIAVHPSGSVWVTTVDNAFNHRRRHPGGLYVITPEASQP